MNPEEVARVADRELEVYSALQQNIHHIPKDENDQRGDAQEKTVIEDLFIPPDAALISWHSSPQLTLFSGTREHNNVKFLINYYFSRVFSFYVSMTLPGVSVLERYKDVCRIAWSPNAAANLLGRGRVIYGKSIAEDFPIYADDLERQFNCGKPGQQEIRMRDSGSIPFLTKWSTSKPQFGPLYATPNFHFTRDLTQCIRASLLDDRSQVSVTFAPRPYQQILRMQVLRQEKADPYWESVPFDPRMVRFEDAKDADSVESRALPFIAKGEVIVVNKEQRAHEVSCNDGYVNYIKHYKVQEKSHVGFGEVAEIEVTHSSVCVAMFVSAFNERAPGFGCHSNYTTNPEDPETGTDPVKSCDLFYDQTLAKSYDAYYMANIESRKFPSQPLEIGYHAVSFCPCDPFSLSPHALRGIVPAKLKLKVKVTLKPHSPEMEGALKDDKFTVVVTMMMVKKLEYVRVDDGVEPAFSITLSE